ncbi:unnamed protein product [Vicia faba]|uniref:Uncharacterized protein n=1 Tax=Vicia faba TaxID=3906 RepID=A0AAV1B615_VICFA|nr:unnamed protein product [Vicia faba]
MAQTLALQFLTLLLFFFMGITARDMKTELRDVDSNEEPYITQYRHTKSGYAASYNTRTHDSNQHYITSYVKHEANQPYITQYRPTSLEAKQTDYITAYRTRTDESNGPYTTAYGKHEVAHPYITQVFQFG